MASRYMKRCSKSLIVMGMQTKTIVRYHLLPVRMAIIKKKKVSVGKMVEELDPLYTVGGNIKWCSSYGKQYGGSSEN